MSSFLTYLSIAAKGIKAGCSTLNKGKATRIRLTKARNLFTPFVVEVITGIMLGDSCVRHQKGCIDAYLYVEQKDAEFVQLLWNYFNTIGIVGAEPHTRCRTDKLLIILIHQPFSLPLPTLFLLKCFNYGIIV